MSKIEWTEKTWNPIVGCSVVSPGCTNCYARRMAARLAAMGQERYAGLTKPTKAGAVWTGVMRAVPSALTLPFKRKAPTTYFVNSMSDLFAEGVADEEIDRVFALMALCPQHTFQILTKRSARMRAYIARLESQREDFHGFAPERNAAARLHLAAQTLDWFVDHPGDGAYLLSRWPGWPLPNVWLGVSAEDQRRADERVPDLLASPAAVRFVSAEPLLGPIDLSPWLAGPGIVNHPSDQRMVLRETPTADGFDIEQVTLDWLIAGGESGPGARPMHPDWARQIRDACAAAGVAFHFKQHGAWTVAVDRERDDPDCRADYSHRLNDRVPGIAWLNRDGGRGFHGERFHVMRRVGRAAAGRILDGVTHDAMPEVRR